ncbi:hypothetical protein Kisp02_54440 [Kineosporia sp. NBRC 101731]|nr:hypothetical protein Kisp02_54440 [Kineosporia sp. NBRC 101731]
MTAGILAATTVSEPAAAAQIIQPAQAAAPNPGLPTTVKPCVTGSPYQDCVTRAEARRQVEAAGYTWAQFLSISTDRPEYEQIFVDLTLDGLAD